MSESEPARSTAAGFGETQKALALPRRAVPLALACLAVLTAEALASRSLSAVAWDAGLLTLFVMMGPAGYVALAGTRHGMVAYALGGGALLAAYVVLVFGLLGQPWTYVIDPGALGALLVLFLVGGWGLGRDILLEARVERSEAEAEARRLFAQQKELEARASALSAERNALLLLRAQLDPHFLFNTLNAIAEWCTSDPKVAEQALLRLSRLLRSMLEGTECASWPLGRELSMLEELGALHRIRDAERYRFRFDVEGEARPTPIPPMLLLPLFENAITHGPAAGASGEIVVVVKRVGERVRVTIDNPGAFRGRREGGRGLAMVEKRAALAYGDAATVSIGARGDRTTAEIVFPTQGPREVT